MGKPLFVFLLIISFSTASLLAEVSQQTSPYAGLSNSGADSALDANANDLEHLEDAISKPMGYERWDQLRVPSQEYAKSLFAYFDGRSPLKNKEVAEEELRAFQRSLADKLKDLDPQSAEMMMEDLDAAIDKAEHESGFVYDLTAFFKAELWAAPFYFIGYHMGRWLIWPTLKFVGHRIASPRMGSYFRGVYDGQRDRLHDRYQDSKMQRCVSALWQKLKMPQKQLNDDAPKKPQNQTDIENLNEESKKKYKWTRRFVVNSALAYLLWITYMKEREKPYYHALEAAREIRAILDHRR